MANDFWQQRPKTFTIPLNQPTHQYRIQPNQVLAFPIKVNTDIVQTTISGFDSYMLYRRGLLPFTAFIASSFQTRLTVWPSILPNEIGLPWSVKGIGIPGYGRIRKRDYVNINKLGQKFLFIPNDHPIPAYSTYVNDLLPTTIYFNVWYFGNSGYNFFNFVIN